MKLEIWKSEFIKKTENFRMFSFWQMLKRSFTNRDEEQLENKEPESKQEEVEPTQPIKEQKFPEEAGTRKQFPPGNRNNGTFRKEVVAVAGQEVVANIPEVVEHEELAPINRENLERDLADLLREIEALERDQVAMSQSFLIKMNEMEQKLKTINHQQSLLIAAAGLGVSVLPPEIPMPERMIHGRVASPSPLHGYHCICKKQYAWLTSLEKHIKFATKEWKFLCDLCNMRFPLASDRRRHMMKTHRVKDPESGFGCMDCGDVLTDRKALCNHKFYMHG